MIKSSGDHLLRVVNEILDYSRLESGKIELDTIDFDIREVIGEADKGAGPTPGAPPR